MNIEGFSLLENKTGATHDEIIDKMISNAWYSVLEFHIHLSGIWSDGGIKDNLERAVVKHRELSRLKVNTSKVEIKNAIKQFNRQFHVEKQELSFNVPYKALSGFANKTSDRISLDSSDGRMMAYYNKLCENDILFPYTFCNENGLSGKLLFSEARVQMIRDNTVAILGWIQSEKCE